MLKFGIFYYIILLYEEVQIMVGIIDLYGNGAYMVYNASCDDGGSTCDCDSSDCMCDTD